MLISLITHKIINSYLIPIDISSTIPFASIATTTAINYSYVHMNFDVCSVCHLTTNQPTAKINKSVFYATRLDITNKIVPRRINIICVISVKDIIYPV
jgi:hypothetical protein